MNNDIKVTNIIAKNAINGKSHRKENNFLRSYKIISFLKSKNEFYEPVDLRIYGKYNGKVYACFWINEKTTLTYSSGSGVAGGYGYDKTSTATQIALTNAGIALSESIEDRGNEAIINALTAIGKYLKIKNFTIIQCHP